jgi:dTDP-4-amino-4,6-dideoxygalactose transaminase
VKNFLESEVMEFIHFSKPTISLEEEDFEKIKDVLRSGWVSIGRYVEELENEFKERFKVKHAIACSCCTQGLIIALKAVGWRNQRVAVPAFTWPSTVFAIESNIGNTPVFCDIDPETWLMDLDSLDDELYDVVLAVDTFGNQADIKTTKPVIYDAAHGFNLEKLGHRGIAEVVSFSFTKVVSASEGGMILTNDDEVAKTAYELRRLASRMEEVNAIIALSSIRKYDYYNKIKLDIIERYQKSLDFNFTLQQVPECTNHSVFSLLLNNSYTRDAISTALKNNEIEVKTYYEPLVEGLAHTDQIYSRIISLPTYPEIVSKQDMICGLINESVKGSMELSRGDASSPDAHLPGKRYLVDSGYLIEYLRREQK